MVPGRKARDVRNGNGHQTKKAEKDKKITMTNKKQEASKRMENAMAPSEILQGEMPDHPIGIPAAWRREKPKKKKEITTADGHKLPCIDKRR